MSQEVTISESESLLVSNVCQLQYRVAKLENYSDEDARKIAKRLCVILVAQINGVDTEVLFSDEGMDNEVIQASLERIGQGLDRTIESVNRLYKNLDSSI